MGLNSEFEVIISDRAQEDYYTILTKIAELTLFKKSVDKWANLLAERIFSLNVMPKRFAVYEFDERFRSTHVGKYRIVYLVNDKKREVIIMRIIYARRDLGKVEI